jgi:hypothetical protein
MKARLLAVPLMLGLIGLGGCGYSTGDRAVTGAGIGAAGGAAIGAVAGGGPGALAGALIGGAAGGATGALTSPDQVNLGKPVYK